MPIQPQDLSNHSIRTNLSTLTGSDLDWLPSFPADTPDDVLRQVYEEHGVLHVKGVMPRDYVLKCRQDFFERVAPAGVLKPGTDPVEGIFVGENEEKFIWPRTINLDPDVDRSTDYAHIAAKWHKDDVSAEFCSNKYLFNMVKRLQPQFEEPIILRRQIFRSLLPKAGGTGIHYDQIYLRHGGASTTMTGWVPIGDCDPSTAGLIYLEKSVEVGEGLEKKFTEMSESKGYTEEEKRWAYNQNMSGTFPLEGVVDHLTKGRKRKWLVGNYEAGDVVFHHMYAIHASGPNQTSENRIRLSVDLRFADKQGEYDHRWNNPFTPGDGL